MSASPFARLMIIGIWGEAWDDGIFEWKPLTLKAKLFPVDSVDTVSLLEELERLQFIKRFSFDGKQYGAVRNFCKWQRPKKPNSSGVLTPELRTYVSLSSDNSEPVRNQFGTSSEKSPQMEDVGGRMEEIDNTSLRARASLDKIETSCRQAGGHENSPDPGFMILAPILGLIDQGANLETEILPAIRAKKTDRAKSWSYYVPIIQDFRASRKAASLSVVPDARAPPAGKPDMYAALEESKRILEARRQA